MKRLVVVESPTKARTIQGILPKDYRVEASRGHVRDLPSNASEIPAKYKGEKWARLGINVEAGFDPLYVVPRDKKPTVKKLREALREADELIIATDEDREGESIGWHLLEVLRPEIDKRKLPVKRMVFHEITREAIERAARETRDLDLALVDAQETRRILDRLVGYSVSPVLWRKVAPKLSAGRVQSVAVRVIVERERERLAFVPSTYWDLQADLEKEGSRFEAKLTHVAGQRVATGKDFDPDTGKLAKPGSVLVLEEAGAKALAKRLPDEPWRVAEVETRQQQRNPSAPFITSTLQQEAGRKLGMSAKGAMRTAQALYEKGLITYMRTDSTTLSQEAVDAARAAIEKRYGKPYLSSSPRQYSGKVRNAQEAHEAIRPAGKEMRTARDLGLSGEEYKLYDLIWKRTVASQMASARLRLVTATITAAEGDDAPTPDAVDVSKSAATFRATGRTVEFPGFFRAYVEGSDDPEAALEDRDQPLPDLAEKDPLACHGVTPDGHETKPPARYTEATIVKTLEASGVGRPSTYASIIETIKNRGYVRKQGSALVPTFTAFAVTRLLEHQFDELVDTDFTAEMESDLDRIADGKAKALPYLERFFNGKEGLQATVDEGLESIDPKAISTIEAPQWAPYTVRVGRYGPYVEHEEGGETLRASLPDDLAPADLTREQIASLLEEGNMDDKPLGIHPEADQPILLKSGPYGPYVQLGDDEEGGPKPKRASLPKGMKAEDATLQLAIDLLRLPRTVGTHPETGNEIIANNGRFGPYVKHEKTFASLGKEDDVLTVGLARAVELITKKDNKNKPLRELGKHPVSGNSIDVRDGRYGPYVKHGKTNATLPKDVSVESVTLAQAVELIDAKEGGKGGKKGAAAKKTSAKKPAAKKTAAKKTASSKAAPKKKTPAKE
jgi:DNA topoisomerase-1